QAEAHVQLPQRPPAAARDPELEPGDDAARPDDPRELSQRRRRVADVTQEIGEGQRIELAVRERERVSARLDELDASVHAPPRLREHAGALVDADDAAARPAHQLE